LNSFKELINHKKTIFCSQRGGEKDSNSVKSENNFQLKKSSFDDFLKEYELVSEDNIKSVNEFFIHHKRRNKELFEKIFDEMQQIKLILCIHVLFVKDFGDSQIDQIGYFCSSPNVIINFDDFKTSLNKIIIQFDEEITKFQNNGSNWRVDNIFRLDVKVAKYRTKYGSGGCYNYLPRRIQVKKAVINIKNNDNKCFLYSIIAKIFPTANNKIQNKVRYYLKHVHKFKLGKLDFPMELKNIGAFEKLNKHLDLSINVYEYNINLDQFFPSRISGFQSLNEVNLLLFRNHYFLIKSFNKLIGCSGGKYRHHCKNCLQAFEKHGKLIQHSNLCNTNKPVRVILPEPGDNILKFKQYHQTIKFPYVCYAGLNLYQNYTNILNKINLFI